MKEIPVVGDERQHVLQRPLMLQNWQSLTFLHWGYPPDQIRALLPAALRRSGIELDTYEGKAWVGLVPFLLTGLRPPDLPAFPWVGHFPETNIRTYVRGQDGKPAVWFFTLEADRLAAVLAARITYGLPYRWAQMSVTTQASGLVEYRSRRSRLFGAGECRLCVQPGPPMTSGSFDDFLTARFRLYSTFGSRVAYADIDHEAWSLRQAHVELLQQNLFENSGLPQPNGELVGHYSPLLQVRIGRPRLL